MSEGLGRERWAHTSAILALVANVNRDPKKRARPYKPDDFNPYRDRESKKRPRRSASKEEMAFLREALMSMKGRGKC